MAASARRAVNDSRGWFSESAFDKRSVIGFKCSEAGLEQVALGYDDDVEPCRDLIAPENLSYQSFSSVSLDRAAQFLRSGHAQPAHRLLVRQEKDGEISAMDADAAVVNLLEFGPPTDFLGRPKPGRHSLLTVSFLRPLARRRFSTRRPFFELILTRKPCVFLRRRLFGWNVRFPFIGHPEAEYRTANVSS